MRQPSVVECSAPSAGGKALLGLEHHPGRARHRLDAAGERQRRVAGLDHAARLHRGVQRRAAEPVDAWCPARSSAARRAAPPCARRRGCPRRPRWRCRTARRRSARDRAPASGRPARGRRARRGRRDARPPARRRSGRTACGRRRRRRRRSSGDAAPAARSSSSVGRLGRWWPGASATRSSQPVACAHLLDADPGVQRGQRQLAVAVGLEHAEVGDHRGRARRRVRRAEVELGGRTCACECGAIDHDLRAADRDLRRAAGARQARPRRGRSRRSRCELRFAWRSICAAPRNATWIRPGPIQ